MSSEQSEAKDLQVSYVDICFGSSYSVYQTANDGEGDKEIFYHPETGEVISKNLYKKFMKGGGVGKKDKKDKQLPNPPNPEKQKEKKEKEKKTEQIYSDSTPAGQFKQIEGFFPETYQPAYVEAAWQSWWEKSGFYAPSVEKGLDADEADKFVMVIPPPNVTGSLHLGHALMSTIEDTLTRWHRMNGKITLWLPGVDHAGIATQSVVERMLMKTEKKTRHELGRENFVNKVWEWKEKYGDRITTQLRFLGASVDWTREVFTMDPKLSKAVNEAFVRFYEDGLLYRDTRLINWSCALQSALSDIEVEFVDLKEVTYLSVPGHTNKEKYEFGTLTSFAYKVADSENPEEEIIVATTRLETMLGDTGVAVHPDDTRYTHLHGKFLIHPFNGRKIPIITDSILVDMSFGTGAVKVTPAHDHNDYLCGKRNNLEFIIMLTDDGKILNSPTIAGQFAGMMRYDARIAMEEEMKKLGLFRGKVPNAMRLGLCSRTNDIIEPMLTPQWYVNCANMAKRSVDAVRNGELKILPSVHESTWYMWLENIRDWCISRQLWWGHRIPAYFVRLPGETKVTMDQNDTANTERWFVGRTEEEARTKAATKLGVPAASLSLTQDEDVLDTWFSSGLFPFSVFGWPDETPDLKAFFPTTVRRLLLP
jgi:valyl-tRNA synthetase